MNAEGAGDGGNFSLYNQNTIPVVAKLYFSNSTNIAEYEGCILGLKSVQKWE